MNAKPKVPRIFWFSTKGTGSNDAIRIDTLLSGFETRKEIPFSKDLKLAGLREIMKTIRAEKPDLVVMEGTGIAGGLSCLYGRLFCRVPYVVSSGDAVGPFMRAHHQLTGLARRKQALAAAHAPRPGHIAQLTDGDVRDIGRRTLVDRLLKGITARDLKRRLGKRG